MTIVFTEEEREWIDRIPFNWQIKYGCPKEIAVELQKKLDLLKLKQA